ncbi:MAG: aspartate aminotransferase family protein [Planctomycetales bacterium]
MTLTKAGYVERDMRYMIHSLHHRGLQQTGHIWVRGEGAYLYDADGKPFIDCLSGLWNVIAGHGRTELVQVAAEQMQTLAYVSGYAGSNNPPAILLAEQLAQLSYPNIKRFFFTSGGGESTDAAVKTARYYWKLKGKPTKTTIICRQWGYHGTTLAAMSATGVPSYWPMFEPLAPGFMHIPSPYPYRYVAPPGSASQGIAAADELEKAILKVGPENVAMFFAEPVQGGTGVIVPQDDYFPRIREICDKYDVLMVMDEVITGFGRTGRMFGLERYGVQPDMYTFAKGITSGYFPLGGVGMNDEIAGVLDKGDMMWMHAYTYSGHPVGCAIALRNLRIIKEENFPKLAEEKGAYLLKKLKEELADHPHVGEVRGLGLMCGVEFVQDKKTKAEFPASEQIGPKVHLATQERGMYTRLRGDVYLLAPPMITEYETLDEMVAILKDSIKAVLG